MVHPASTERTVLAGSALQETLLTINSALNMMWCFWTCASGSCSCCVLYAIPVLLVELMAVNLPVLNY